MSDSASLGDSAALADSSRYASALGRLFALKTAGIKLDLLRVKQAARLLGDPHLRYPCVHIGGTNGKGSTAAMVESVLRTQGYRTGLYTSPHLCRFTERIRMAKPTASGTWPLTEVERDVVAELVPWMLRRFPELTFFEITTLLAFEVFRREAVDIAVIEVGLGGRLDATNILRLPLVTAITSIALDHQQILGRNRVAIAREKAGIFKPGRPAVVSLGLDAASAAGWATRRNPREIRDEELAEQAAVFSAIAQMAEQVGAILRLGGRDFGTVAAVAPERGFRYWGPGAAGVRAIERLGMAGAHQVDNATVALAILGQMESDFPVSDEAIADGLGSATWPCRFEMFALGRPRGAAGSPESTLIIDGAHNPDGTAALAASLRSLGRSPTTTTTSLIFGALEDKDAKAMLAPLLSRQTSSGLGPGSGAAPEPGPGPGPGPEPEGQSLSFERIIFVAPPNGRARAPSELEALVPAALRPSVHVAASATDALWLAQGTSRIVVAGSLYLAGQVRAMVTGERVDDVQVSDPAHVPIGAQAQVVTQGPADVPAHQYLAEDALLDPDLEIETYIQEMEADPENDFLGAVI